MWLPLELLMETNQNLCFGLVVKVSKSWLFIVLVLLPQSLLACRGGGGGGGDQANSSESTTGSTTIRPKPKPKFNPPDNAYRDTTHRIVDSPLKINLKNANNTYDKSVKTGHDGWVPFNQTQLMWKKWYDAWKKQDDKNDKKTTSPVKGRGPGSGFPDLFEWQELGEGDAGDPIPPWANKPLNLGRPNICYLPPVRGETCPSRMENGTKGARWGYNPYKNDCDEYYWNGCGGTRNRFLTKEKCFKYCFIDPPVTCTIDSGIKDKSEKKGR